MNHNLKEVMLPDCYEYSLADVAEKTFMHINTARRLEKSAIENFKQIFAERGLSVKDFL
jgi:hypothetical protein